LSLETFEEMHRSVQKGNDLDTVMAQAFKPIANICGGGTTFFYRENRGGLWVTHATSGGLKFWQQFHIEDIASVPVEPTYLGGPLGPPTVPSPGAASGEGWECAVWLPLFFHGKLHAALQHFMAAGACDPSKIMPYLARLDGMLNAVTLICGMGDLITLYQKDLEEALLGAVGLRHEETRHHMERVGRYCELISGEMGKSEKFVAQARLAGLLHDVGKIALDLAILDGTHALSPEDREEAEKHPLFTERILTPLKTVSDIVSSAVSHHEREDGKGYPRGLTKEEIDEIAKIVAVADVFDALVADRSYRKGMPRLKVLAMMEASKEQLNADVVAVMRKLVLGGDMIA
jgi:hypothetical protein